MVYLLVIGLTLIVLAFRLVPLLFGAPTPRKKEKICGAVLMAVLMMALAGIVGTVPGVASWVNLSLKSQEVSALANTAVTLMITGFVLGLQELILAWPKEDERRKLRKVIECTILVLLILGVACIVWYLVTRG